MSHYMIPAICAWMKLTSGMMRNGRNSECRTRTDARINIYREMESFYRGLARLTSLKVDEGQNENFSPARVCHRYPSFLHYHSPDPPPLAPRTSYTIAHSLYDMILYCLY